MKEEFIKVCKEAGTKPKALGDVLGGIAIVIGETTNAEKFKTNILLSVIRRVIKMSDEYAFEIKYKGKPVPMDMVLAILKSLNPELPVKHYIEIFSMKKKEVT